MQSKKDLYQIGEVAPSVSFKYSAHAIMTKRTGNAGIHGPRH